MPLPQLNLIGRNGFVDFVLKLKGGLVHPDVGVGQMKFAGFNFDLQGGNQCSQSCCGLGYSVACLCARTSLLAFKIFLIPTLIK